MEFHDIGEGVSNSAFHLKNDLLCFYTYRVKKKMQSVALANC